MLSHHFDESYQGNAAQNYQRYFVPVIGKPLALRLLDVADLQKDEQVLDVGCGTGVVTRLAARRVQTPGRVAGLDINPGMLEVARAETRAPDRVEWHEGSADDLPFADGRFDVVLCQMGLQFFPRPAAAMSEMHRVLRPGGRAVLNLPGPIAPLFRVLSKAVGTHVTPQASKFVDQVFALDDPDHLRSLIQDAGFSDVEVRTERPVLGLPSARDFLWQYVSSTPLGALVKAAGEEALTTLEEEVVGAWAAFTKEGRMEYQQSMLVGRGMKKPH